MSSISSTSDQAAENGAEELNSTKRKSVEEKAKVGERSSKRKSSKAAGAIEENKENSAKRKAATVAAEERSSTKGNAKKTGASQGPKGKKIAEEQWKWKATGKIEEKIDSSLSPDVLHEFGEDNTPVFVFETVFQFTELIQLIVEQTNICANQNGRVFSTDVDEMKAFIGINYIMGINKLPSLAEYWQVDDNVGNNGIKKVTTR